MKPLRVREVVKGDDRPNAACLERFNAGVAEGRQGKIVRADGDAVWLKSAPFGDWNRKEKARARTLFVEHEAGAALSSVIVRRVTVEAVRRRIIARRGCDQPAAIRRQRD